MEETAEAVAAAKAEVQKLMEWYSAKPPLACRAGGGLFEICISVLQHIQYQPRDVHAIATYMLLFVFICIIMSIFV